MNRRLVSCTIVIAISGAAAQAHHSLSAVYDTSRHVTVKGLVTHFQFIHPHPLVLLDVAARGSAKEAWRLELDNRRELASIGMTGDTLKAGDHVVVTGSPGRKQRRSLYVRSLDRPADGFRYEQVGDSPRIRGAIR